MGGPSTAAGAKLGRYQIVKHLASGGMAEVLLARATGIEGFTRHVVIKRIRPGQAKDQAFVQMFLNEARIAAQLHHANIVQVHDIGQEGNEYFFAMEYVHGEDLRRLLTHLARHKQYLPVEHIVTIISAAAVALHHAHEQRGADRKPLGIVHRDVTPANILVGYDGNVKVVDFGIAKAALKTEETQAGTLKGKASYMSPEQCTGSKVDRRSDVFALGIVLYELSTTRRLFKAENDFLTMSAIVGGKIPAAKQYRRDLPDELEAIMLKALALKAEDRYQSADEMREALEQFAARAGLRTSTSALAAYIKQQFGERPEPWLVDDDEVEVQVTVDFDGSASALVSPPDESLHQLAIPQDVDALNSSPIVKARTKAITGEPQTSSSIRRVMPLAPPGVPPKKPMTVQVPVVTVPAAPDKSRPFRIDAGPVPTPLAPQAPRRKPITVQIPVVAQTAGAAPKKVETFGGLPGVAPARQSSPAISDGVPSARQSSPAMSDGVPHDDSDEADSNVVTVVSAGVSDIDSSWDVSAAFSAIQTPEPKKAPSAKPAAGAKPAASAEAKVIVAADASVESKTPARGDATPKPAGAKSAAGAKSVTVPAAIESKSPPRADATPAPKSTRASAPVIAAPPREGSPRKDETPLPRSTTAARADATPVPKTSAKTTAATSAAAATIESKTAPRRDATPVPSIVGATKTAPRGDATPPPTGRSAQQLDSAPTIIESRNERREATPMTNRASREDITPLPAPRTDETPVPTPRPDATPITGTVPRSDATPITGTVPRSDATPITGTVPRSDATPITGTVPRTDATPTMIDPRTMRGDATSGPAQAGASATTTTAGSSASSAVDIADDDLEIPIETDEGGGDAAMAALLGDIAASDRDAGARMNRPGQRLDTPPPLPMPPSPQRDADQPKTWSLTELASHEKPVDKNDVSMGAKFDVGSLSSSRTDASNVPVPFAASASSPGTGSGGGTPGAGAPAGGTPGAGAGGAADPLAAADAVAESVRVPGTDGRDSAPLLPPPPATRKSVKLPGVAQGDDAGPADGFGSKLAANAFGPGRAKVPSSMPETWPGGTSSVKVPSRFAALARSPVRIALIAGGLVLIVAVIVLATTGGSKRPAAPDRGAPGTSGESSHVKVPAIPTGQAGDETTKAGDETTKPGDETTTPGAGNETTPPGDETKPESMTATPGTPSDEATAPSDEATRPGATTKPGTAVTTTKPAEPATTKPATTTTKPGTAITTTKPATTTTKPGAITKPATTTTTPGSITKPATTTATKPGTTTTKPGTTATKPAITTTTKPATTTAKPGTTTTTKPGTATKPALTTTKPGTTKPATTTTKPGTKPATNPPAKKWDPNTLFPTRK